MFFSTVHLRFNQITLLTQPAGFCLAISKIYIYVSAGYIELIILNILAVPATC